MPQHRWSAAEAHAHAQSQVRRDHVAAANRRRAVIASARQQPSHPISSIISPDPYAALALRLTRQTQAGASPATLVQLASALARLRPRTGAGAKAGAKAGSGARPAPELDLEPMLAKPGAKP